MASPEWSGALVDAAAAPAPRRDRLTRLATHTGRFALAYLAFEAAWSGPFTVVSPLTAGLVLIASAPIAWLPFSVALYLAPNERTKQIVGCLLAGTIVGMSLAIQAAIFLAWTGMAPPDTTPPSADPFSWLAVAKELPSLVGICAPIGAVGGLVFWFVFSILPLARLPDDAATGKPERRGTLADQSSLPRREDRPIELGERISRFAAAYAAFEIAAAVALSATCVAAGFANGMPTGVLFLASTAPIAWIPLSLALYIARKARIRPIVASIFGVTIAGAVLATAFAILEVCLALMGSGGVGLAFPWLDVALLTPRIMLVGAPGAAVGGLVFWAVYFQLYGHSGTSPARAWP